MKEKILLNLFKFVLVLLSASVERVGVSRMRDFFYPFPKQLCDFFRRFWTIKPLLAGGTVVKDHNWANFGFFKIFTFSFIHNFYRLYVTTTTLLWTLSTLSTLQARCRYAAGWLHSVQSAYSLQNPMIEPFVQLNTKHLSVELNWWNFAHT